MPTPRISAVARTIFAAGLLCALAHAGAQQPAAKPPAYEVVSIKQTKGAPNSGGIMSTPDGFSMRNLPLRSLVSDAYGTVLDEDIRGWPSWAAFPRFDIEARMAPEAADALHKLPKPQQEQQRRLMLQSLLADRFKLKVHRVAELRTAYELVVARGGPRMKEDNPPPSDPAELPEGAIPRTDWQMSDGKIAGHAMPISVLVGHLPSWVDAAVVDKTGLTARYDVTLTWDPRDPQDPSSTGPSIFTALEDQLGLLLKPTKTTAETIVIDHLEPPSEN